ncbi:ML domain-containing protein [Aphelenchoides besseyi]|nr:ML domain-containing protein [Aphelenchoides besseyi]KAI6224964.1 ML domain-containing protein [Aphelenchoides besseyi]
MLRYAFVFSTLLICVVGADDVYVPVSFKPCKSIFEVVSVESTSCPLDAENRCIFTHGEQPRIRIGFKPNREVAQLKTQVRARIEGTFVSFHLDNEDACNGQNVTCPLKANQLVYYSQQVNIVRDYPAVEVMVNWILNDPTTFDDKKEPYYDEDGERVKNDLCVVFLAKVNEKN